MTTTKVNSEFIAVNAISGTIIADGAITSTHLAVNSVDSSELVTGSIDSLHIAANQVTATKIVTNGVLTRHISDDQVTADKLANSINTDIATGPAALPKAGGTMTGDLILGDNVKVEIGSASGGDLQLYHDGGNSFIKSTTGWLNMPIGGNGVSIANSDFSEQLAVFKLNDAVELYHNGSKKLETEAGGVHITGYADADNFKIAGAQGSDGQVLTSTGSGVAWEAAGGGVAGIVSNANATAITIDSSEKVAIGSTVTNKLFNLADPAQGGETLKLHFEAESSADNWAIYSYDRTNGHYADMSFGQNAIAIKGSNSNVGIGTTAPGNVLDVTHSAGAHTPVLRLTGSSTSGYAAGLEWYSGYGPKVSSQMFSTASGSQGGEYWQEVRNQSSNTLKRTYHVSNAAKHTFHGQHNGDSTGHFLFTNQLYDATNTNCSLVVQNGGTFIQVMGWTTLGARIGTRTGGWNSNSGGDVHFTRNDSMQIKLGSSGPVLSNGTAISSDERLKKNIANVADGQLAKINALTVRTFEWKNPDSQFAGTQEGFIAQEVESVIPEAVKEETMAPDPHDESRDFEGNVKLLKHDVINARLIKAVQELSAKLEAAEARITTLEG